MPDSRACPRERRTRLATLVASAAAVALIAAACGASDPPPRSPLDEGTPNATPTAAATAIPGPADTPTPDPTPGAPADDGNGAGGPVGGPAGDHEGAVARAIELLAEWTGMAATDLDVAAVEDVEWSDACLGIDRPDLACADVITPGVRVELQTLLGATMHAIHVSDAGRYSWAHERVVDAELIEVDQAAGAVRVATGEGDQDWLLVPGSEIDVPLAALDPGMPLTAGLDEIQDGDAIVWLTVR